jgi:hypothetical protein
VCGEKKICFQSSAYFEFLRFTHAVHILLVMEGEAFICRVNMVVGLGVGIVVEEVD